LISTARWYLRLTVRLALIAVSLFALHALIITQIAPVLGLTVSLRLRIRCIIPNGLGALAKTGAIANDGFAGNIEQGWAPGGQEYS